MESIKLLGTFKSIRRNKGGTDLVLTVDDKEWAQAAKLATTEGFVLKLTIEILSAEIIGQKRD